ncbi:hypothetical protein ACFVS2_26240 [Brevibacillus sp. NPDC058079]|uniref:hypothetical protein n=1 Tax=Brevibacillus sp. NPDC058079 TaxID=3346330 RepID=UPI0036E874FA
MSAYYCVEKDSTLHSDLEITMSVKGNFLKEMNEEISEAIKIKNALQKIAYIASSQNSDLLIEEAYKNEIPDKYLKKSTQESEGKTYYAFKQNSPYQKAFTKFIKDHNLGYIIKRQSLFYVCRILHNFNGSISVEIFNGTFYIESSKKEAAEGIKEITESEFFKVKMMIAEQNEVEQQAS